MGAGGSTVSPLEEEEEVRASEPSPGSTLVRIGIFSINPVTKTGGSFIIRSQRQVGHSSSGQKIWAGKFY